MIDKTKKGMPLWPHDFVVAVNEMSGFTKSKHLSMVAARHPIGETLDKISRAFGFEPDKNAEKFPHGSAWYELREFLSDAKLDFSKVRGPHAMTILKAMAARHGRSNVSVQGE